MKVKNKNHHYSFLLFFVLPSDYRSQGYDYYYH